MQRSRQVVPKESHGIRHIDAEDYECGGPHYLPPGGGDWYWCESLEVWFASPVVPLMSGREE